MTARTSLVQQAMELVRRSNGRANWDTFTHLEGSVMQVRLAVVDNSSSASRKNHAKIPTAFQFAYLDLETAMPFAVRVMCPRLYAALLMTFPNELPREWTVTEPTFMECSWFFVTLLLYSPTGSLHSCICSVDSFKASAFGCELTDIVHSRCRLSEAQQNYFGLSEKPLAPNRFNRDTEEKRTLN